MSAYPVRLEDDDGSVMVTFPDFPEAVTFGEDEADALAHAEEALVTVIAAYMADRRDIPAPSTADDAHLVALPLLAALKIEVYRAMRAKGWRKADLARALERNPRQVDRLLDVLHGSPAAELEKALKACEGAVDVSPLPRIDVSCGSNGRWSVDIISAPAGLRRHAVVGSYESQGKAIERANTESAALGGAPILLRPAAVAA